MRVAGFAAGCPAGGDKLGIPANLDEAQFRGREGPTRLAHSVPPPSSAAKGATTTAPPAVATASRATARSAAYRPSRISPLYGDDSQCPGRARPPSRSSSAW